MSIELTSYVKLKVDSKYQFVYASKDYDTFYCIYARFHVSSDILNKIELYIENYKGLLNIGFIRENIDSKYIFCNDDTLRIPLPVKVSNSFKKTTIDLSTKNININNFHHIHLKKYLFPQSYLDPQNTNIKVDLGNTFFDDEFKERIRDINNPTTKLKEQLEDGKVIDFKHFEEQVLKIETPLKFVDYLIEKFNISNNITSFKDAVSIKAIGNNCIDSFIETSDN